MDGPDAPDITSAPRLSALFDELFPLMRSITGEGYRRSLQIIGRHMPLTVESVPTDTKVFDWIVPPEWIFRSARLWGPDGKLLLDASKNSLEILNYSAPMAGEFTRGELDAHLHSLPEFPSATPYVTSYYVRRWGFCLPHERRLALPEGRYRVEIDTEFRPGSVDLAYSDLAGESPAQILLTSYLCHPSLANNELSGPLVLLGLYSRLRRWPRRRFSYRFLLNPETIGALCYLHRHANDGSRAPVAGLTLTCVGGPAGELSYKASRRGDTHIDELMKALAGGAVSAAHLPVALRPFDPAGGSDERQYCSPGFDWPMGQIARSVYGEYPGYHNSLDDKAFMGIERLVQSIDAIEDMLRLAESSVPFRNLSPFGEPQLGRRNLYPTLGSHQTRNPNEKAVPDGRAHVADILRLLNGSDGRQSALQIARRYASDFRQYPPVIETLEREGLLAFVDPGAAR